MNRFGPEIFSAQIGAEMPSTELLDREPAAFEAARSERCAAGALAMFGELCVQCFGKEKAERVLPVVVDRTRAVEVLLVGPDVAVFAVVSPK